MKETNERESLANAENAARESRGFRAVYRDGRYELGTENGRAVLLIGGEPYRLSCHPFDPCLYITARDGRRAAVRGAFDPDAAVEEFAKGRLLTSITGREYDARDFCRMAEYAAGLGEIAIDDAERVFGGEAKKKTAVPGNRKADVGVPFPSDEKETLPRTDGWEKCGSCAQIITEDPFFDVLGAYRDAVIDFCLLKIDAPYDGLRSHRAALAAGTRAIFDGEWELRSDPSAIAARKLPPEELFALSDEIGEKLNYRTAFRSPPFPNGYTDADFERLNEALFPFGRDGLEAFAWSTYSAPGSGCGYTSGCSGSGCIYASSWSDYFDDGREWWGTLCLTVYDSHSDRFAVLMASETD